MDRNLGLILHVLTFLLSCFLPACNCDCNSTPKAHGGFTGMFVFGDSIVDGGNSNFLTSTFKANYPPYGIDFPPGRNPTARFTNGKNEADRIGDLLMLPFLPASSDPRAKRARISKGVNYASAGSGILDATGSNTGVISLNQQIQNFVEMTLPDIQVQQGCQSTNLLQQYLFLLSTGSNDYLTNFFPGRSTYFPLEYFTANLTDSLASQVNKLYSAGARKFAFLNVGPLGCSPKARAAMPNKACNEILNYAAFLYNSQLVVALNNMRPRMPGLQFVVVNIFQIVLEFIRNPSFGGFIDVNNSCCEVSVKSGGTLCKPGGMVCPNRSFFLFFDGLHPTEALYGIVAARAYNSSSSSEVYPFNIRMLGQL